MSMRVTRSIAVIGACALWAACSKGENKDDTAAADTSHPAAAATDTGAAAAAAQATPQLSDANIAAILDNANAADSAAGKIASTKGTRADVKDFGRTMMRDHHALRKQGQDLVKKLKLTPQMPAGDTSAAAATHWQDSLNAMPKGAAWDKAYIDHEVAAHEAVLQTLQTAEAAAQNAELKDLIKKATPNIQAHLDKAKATQQKLSGSAATTKK